MAVIVASCARPIASDVSAVAELGSARGTVAHAAATPGKAGTMDCKGAATHIANRDFVGWRGIPPGCGAAELFGPPPPDLAARRPRELGDDRVPAMFWMLELVGYYRPVASIVGGEPVLFDAMNPELAGGFAALRDDLGAPGGRLDWERGVLAIAGGEWVYPERGITLFVEPGAADTALHIAVYHPTTLEHYRRMLRPHLGARRMPL